MKNNEEKQTGNVGEIKLAIARRQLGTALDLFIHDQDPVSVHCLACGGGELAHHIADLVGATTFNQHALLTFPDIDLKELRRLRNQYWNGMKHWNTHGGKPRDDSALLEVFDDAQNDHALFVGWYDFANAACWLPVEAQAFQAWYFARFPEKLADVSASHTFERLFPGVRSLQRNDAKALLRRKIKRTRDNREVMGDPKTDRRQLILGRAEPLHEKVRDTKQP